MAFSPDGRMIAAVGVDGKMRPWDGATAEPLSEPITAHKDGVSAVAFSPDGKTIVSGGMDGTVRQWNAKTSQPIGDPITTNQGGVSAVACSLDSRTILSNGYTVRLWDARTGDPVGHPIGYSETGPDDMEHVAFSPNRRMIAAGGQTGNVRRWDVTTGKPIGGPMTGHHGSVINLAFSPDGRMIASRGVDGTLRRWNAGTGSPIGEPMIASKGPVFIPAASLTFSPDGQRTSSHPGPFQTTNFNGFCTLAAPPQHGDVDPLAFNCPKDATLVHQELPAPELTRRYLRGVA